MTTIVVALSVWPPGPSRLNPPAASDMDEAPPRVLPGAILVVWAVLLGSITLTPGPRIQWWNVVEHGCIVCGSRGAADAVLNVVLFLPLGALLRAYAPPLRTLGVGLLLSTGIELAQWLIPGRYPTLGDVLWNGTGVAVGLALALLLRREFGRPAPSTRVLALVLALPFAYLMGSGWLLAPLETDQTYYGQWTPELGFMPRYRGRVLAARSSVGAVPDGPWPGGAGLRDDADGWWLEADVVVGPDPGAVSPVVSVADGLRQEILLLGIMDDDLVWRERTWANGLLFDRPDERIRGGLRDYAPGDTVTLAVRSDGTSRCLRVDDEEVCGLGVSPGRTWGMLMYLEGASRRQRRILDVAWMATLFLLLGVVAGARWRTVGLTFVAVVLVVVATATTRLLAPGVLDLAGLGVGVGAGVLLRGPVRLVLGRQGEGGDVGRPLQ